MPLISCERHGFIWRIRGHFDDVYLCLWLSLKWRTGRTLEMTPRAGCNQASAGLRAHPYSHKGSRRAGLTVVAPEEPTRSHLEEWFMNGQQAPHQRPTLFTKSQSWHAPYLVCIHYYSSSALTSVDGTEKKGYSRLLPLEKATHLCQPLAGRLKQVIPLSHAGLHQPLWPGRTPQTIKLDPPCIQ